MAVTLWAADIPVIGFFARHHWLLIYRDSGVSRWEVWQRANAGGSSTGHLHRDLLPPTSGVGNGPGTLLREWSGERAQAIARRVETAPDTYPWCHRYHYWPGPNSNTFIQWVLQDDYQLCWRSPGKHFKRLTRTLPDGCE